MSVSHWKHAVGRNLRMRVAHSRRVLARREVIGRLIGKQRHRAIKQRHVDLLSLARPLAHQQGGLDCIGSPDPGREVRDRNAHLDRSTARLAGQ